MLSTVLFSFVSVVVLVSFVQGIKRGRIRKAKFEAISVAPLPQLPLLFQWNWSGIISTIIIGVLILPLISLLVAYGVPTLIFAAASGVVSFIVYGFWVSGYLLFALKGPSFILDADGIEFAGHHLPWCNVESIEYTPSGRTPNIRFRNTDSKAKGFSIIDQFYGRTSISANFISDPDSVVGWSRRLKLESQKGFESVPAS